MAHSLREAEPRRYGTPWRIAGNFLVDRYEHDIAEVRVPFAHGGLEYAQRITASVNACADFSAPTIGQMRALVEAARAAADELRSLANCNRLTHPRHGTRALVLSSDVHRAIQRLTTPRGGAPNKEVNP